MQLYRKFFNLFIAILPAILLASVAFGQEKRTCTLFGTVTDKESGEPLAGVSVMWVDESNRVLRGLITDANGSYTLEEIECGNQRVVFKMLGFKTAYKYITFYEGEIKELNLALEPALQDIATVEILGTSLNKFRKQPGAATKIASRTIETIQPVGTQQILQMIPGIHAFTDDGFQQSRINIGIRGLNPRRSSRILFLEDGIPIQPAAYVYPNMYYNPPPERISEIEVIKGSAAIRYGPQTMGGVINYITHKPRKQFGGMVQVTGGSYKYLSIFTEIGGWGNNHIHPEIQLLFKRGDGWRENNAFEQYNATLKTEVVPNTKTNILFKANFNYENSNATYTGLTEYSFETNPRFNPKKYDNFKVLRGSFDVIYQKEIKSGLTGLTKLFTSVFDRRWWRENDVFVKAEEYEATGEINPVPWYTPGNLIRIGNGKDNMGILRTFYVLGAEHNYEWQHTIGKHSGKLLAGGRLYWERFIDDKKKGFSPDARDGVYYITDTAGNITIVGQSHHYETTAFAAFLQEKFTVNNLEITAGSRFEAFEQELIDRLAGSRYKDKTTVVLLPGIGINYGFKRFNLYGGLHRGFTPPSSGTLNVLNFGNNEADLDLKAEKSWNTELGVRGNTTYIDFDITGFHLYITDLVAAGRGTAFKNLGAVMTYGIENALTFRIPATAIEKENMLAVIVNYTYLRTKILKGIIPSSQKPGDVDISGNELPYAPHHSLVADIAKTWPFGLHIRIGVQYVSEVFTDFENLRFTENRGDTGPVPAYYLLHAYASYNMKNKWNFFLSGENLLDKKYIGSRLHSNPGQPQAHLSSGILPGVGRVIKGGVKYTFGANY